MEASSHCGKLEIMKQTHQIRRTQNFYMAQKPTYTIIECTKKGMQEVKFEPNSSFSHDEQYTKWFHSFVRFRVRETQKRNEFAGWKMKSEVHFVSLRLNFGIELMVSDCGLDISEFFVGICVPVGGCHTCIENANMWKNKTNCELGKWQFVILHANISAEWIECACVCLYQKISPFSFFHCSFGRTISVTRSQINGKMKRLREKEALTSEIWQTVRWTDTLNLAHTLSECGMKHEPLTKCTTFIASCNASNQSYYAVVVAVMNHSTMIKPFAALI